MWYTARMRTESYVTVQEAASLLDVHQQVLRKAIWDGRLPSTTVFGRIVISLSDIEVYRARTRPDGVKPRGRPKKVVS